jgi:ubiquinone/menaquinone biosynthesis C-methylase UbiE
MFKSLHHVPMDRMDTAMAEIHRVLKPGGQAYLSEPVYAGDYNAMMSLFHDEKEVREHAFAAVQKAVDRGLFHLKEQIFFKTVRRIESAGAYKQELLGRTFVEHKLDDATWEKVREKIEKNMTGDGAVFLQPHRVDLVYT